LPFTHVQPATRRPSLTLVPNHPRKKHSPLALWHLLSLDAPTVAAIWTLFIAQVAGVAIPWTAPAAMFLAVWMLYAADRLLDARPTTPPVELEDRHRFHHRHRRAFLTAIALVAIPLMILLHNIDPRALHLYTLLATLLAVYLLLIHANPDHSHRLPKELAVGLFFPAAVFIPTIARAPNLRLNLLPAAILFAAVCTLNCLFVYAWEHPSTQPNPRAHWTTRWATQHLTPITLTIIAVTAIAATLHLPYLRLPALACTISVTLLLLLRAYPNYVRSVHLRAAADLVLLTPLVFLSF